MTAQSNRGTQPGVLNRPARRSRIAVVGVGAMGWHHVRNYHALPEAELVAVVDPNPDRLTAVRGAFECATYRTVDELLACEVIDAASLVVPATLHCELACQLLAADVHTLVEKPIATHVDDARRMTQLSLERQRVLQVGHITRFFSSVQYLNQHVLQPQRIEAMRMTPIARISDVGVILDLMIHDIDIVLGLVQAAVVEVTAHSERRPDSQHEDAVSAEVVFENGCVARFRASRMADDVERVLSIVEPSRTLHLDFARARSTTAMTIHSVANDDAEVTHSERVFEQHNPLRDELAHFLARIQSGVSPIGTLAADVRSLDLATAIRARCRSSNSVSSS